MLVYIVWLGYLSRMLCGPCSGEHQLSDLYAWHTISKDNNNATEK